MSEFNTISRPSQRPDLLNNTTHFPELPKSGPLTEYRRRATIDWRKVKLAFNDEASLELQQKVWNFFQNNPLFARPSQTLSLDESRRLATKRMYAIKEENIFGIDALLERPDFMGYFSHLLMAYDPSFSIKFSLGFGMFPSVIQALDVGRLSHLVEQNQRGEILGSFGLTEISHGTNAKGMRTTATYDVKSKEYILHTPDFEAAKCWIGNLGKTCTHMVCYAQLYTADGKHHGLNAFVVPIRDPKTLNAYPGVIVGDLGEKAGLQGLDNGFVMFRNYRISRDYLLARTGDVNEEGVFVSPYKDENKRFGASLGALSGGRVGICGIANMYLMKAISIAIRYSASRKQFGPDDKSEEWPVLEYQSQQYRLYPHLANAFTIKMFTLWFAKIYGEIFLKTLTGERVEHVGMEIHALSSAAKAISQFLKDYANHNDFRASWKTPSEATDINVIMEALNWLVAYLLDTTAQKVANLKKQGKSSFTARNESQSFYARTLSMAYGERVIMFAAMKFLRNLEDGPEKVALTRLVSLFGANVVIKHVGVFYQGGYFAKTANALELLQQGVLDLLPLITVDSVALIDAIAPPDFVLNSPLGMSDGEVYKHMESAILQAPEALERPKWWREVVYRDYVKPKL
ncbi:hypothetical protein quinque_016433 [Culex quinquefasciatus]